MVCVCVCVMCVMCVMCVHVCVCVCVSWFCDAAPSRVDAG